ncbi:hypothetical protein V6R21_00430 [Limibacter armeniacum]|uniref:hypothetical protein n=1 Tax=Limibacter armeniacum TaxID=466084 RepID=UPI002FE4FFC3
MKQSERRIKMVAGSDEVEGVYFYDLDITLWLEQYSWANHIHISPDYTHILIDGGWVNFYCDIIDVSALRMEAETVLKQRGKQGEEYHWTRYKGTPVDIRMDDWILSRQDGDEMEFITQHSYNRLDLQNGIVTEYIRIFSYHDDWVLALLEKDLYLLDLKTRESFQLTKDCSIQAALLNSRNSYCLIAAGGLVMYYLKQPFGLMNDATAKHASQWKTFPLLHYESIQEIEPMEKEFEYRIGLSHQDHLDILLNVKTDDYQLIEKKMS